MGAAVMPIAWREFWAQVLASRRVFGTSKPPRRPIGQYQCPHGFATVAACPTCSHFAQVEERER
jgi:hypothetical protein